MAIMVNEHRSATRPATEGAELQTSKAAGQAAVRPALGPLPAVEAVDKAAHYAVSLSREVEYLGATLRPGQSVTLTGTALLNDNIRAAIDGASKS